MVRERPKVLRPVAQGRDRFLEGVGTVDTIGGSKPLKQKAVLGVVDVPPHLQVSACQGGLLSWILSLEGRVFSYMILASLFAVYDLWTLETIVRGDVWMVLNRR